MTSIDLYTRLSVLKDGSDSIERQEEDLRLEAERQGKTVRKVWSDGKSGYKENVKRPDFDKAIAAVTKGEVPELWVWKLDRLSRQGAGKVGTILDALHSKGGKLYFLKDGLDSTVANSRMLIVLTSEQALAESRNTSLRVSAKNDSKIAQGLPVAGKRRFGYLGADATVGRLGNVEPHPEEAPQVQALFQEFLNGASIRSLSLKMNWRTLRVRETLTNPSYAGWVVRAGQKYPAHESIARLIDQDMFDAVQARLAMNTAPNGGGVIKHLASGIAECGVCHKPMQFRNGYMCLDDLSHPWIKEEILDGEIDLKVIETFMDPASVLKDDGSAVSLYAINAEIAKLEEDIQDVLTGLQTGLKMYQLQPQLQPLQEALAGAQGQQEAILAESVQHRLIADIASSMGESSLNKKLTVLTKWSHMSLDHKRELLRGLFTIVVNPGRGGQRVVIERKHSVSR